MWINYRKEMDHLFSGDSRSIGQAYWAVLRMSRIGDYSQYWDDNNKQAIGGPKWNYDDLFVKVISTPAGSMSSGSEAKNGVSAIKTIGMDDIGRQIFAIEYDSIIKNPRWSSLHGRRLPNQEDILYRIDRCVGKRPPRGIIKVMDRFKILNPEYVRGDDGRVEFILLLGMRNHGEK